MARTTVGLVSPGAMGARVGATVVASGHEVRWAGEGRSKATIERAEVAGLLDVGALDDLVGSCDVLLSVCPPDEATAVATAVAERGFSGTYVDGNAVAPATARAVAGIVGPAATYVDGGIVGPPPVKAGTTRLYLSGEHAGTVAPLFDAGPLAAVVLGDEPVAASALKMCYSGYSKGSTALLLAVHALAEAEGVDGALLAEWELSRPQATKALEGAVRNIGKAWRFVGEMQEVAAAHAAVGLPSRSHDGTAEIFGRLAEFKGHDGDVPLERIVEALQRNS